jgi:hypothetical protein
MCLQLKYFGLTNKLKKMKKYIKFLTLIGLVLTFTSCVEDETTYQANGEGPNLAGFVKSKINASVVADGEDKEVLMTVKLIGPTSSAFKEDIDVIVEVDPSSTAVEGVHYNLDSYSLSLGANSNYIDNLKLTVITDGISPPLVANPKLKLNIKEISSNAVLPNGRTSSIDITLEYLCYSPITGKYTTPEAEYYRIGVLSYDQSVWPEEVEIIYICNNVYRFLEYCGPFDGNEWYFEVETDAFGNVVDGAEITYPATNPDGDPQLLNGQPLITCELDASDLSNIPCDSSSNYVEVDGDNVTLHMSFGYFTDGSGSREFYQVMNKIN